MIVQILFERGYVMALSDETLEQIVYSLSRVNSLHSAMDKFISKDMERKPATKYLDLYLMMFWWLQKNKDLNQTQMSDLLFRIVTGHVDYHMRANMIPVTIFDLVDRPLPIDTKGFF